MKFRTSRELKNMILSVNFAILTFFKFWPIFWNILGSVGMTFFFFLFLEGNKNCRVGIKNRVGRVSGNTGIFLGLSRIAAMSSAFIEYDTNPYGQLWGNTTSYESLKICMTRPRVQCCTVDWFRTTVRQGCLRSSSIFNIFLESIMCVRHWMTVKVVSASEDGLLPTYFFFFFRFTDGIVVNTEEEEKANVLVGRLDTTITRYKMEIGRDKTKKRANN